MWKCDQYITILFYSKVGQPVLHQARCCWALPGAGIAEAANPLPLPHPTSSWSHCPWLCASTWIWDLFLFFFFFSPPFKIVFWLSFSNSDLFSDLSRNSPPPNKGIIACFSRGDRELVKDQCKPGTSSVASSTKGFAGWNCSWYRLSEGMLYRCTMYSAKVASAAPFPHQCSRSLTAVFAWRCIQSC